CRRRARHSVDVAQDPDIETIDLTESDIEDS
ncbi:hypothetical protein F441_21515, partial [Phytophthora nicotianae CJ01A1]